MVKVAEVIEIELKYDKKKSVFRNVIIIILSSSKCALLSYRLASILHQRGQKIIPQILKKRLEKTYGLHISLKAEIGLGLNIPHANGIIIGDGVVIGENSTIYQQVTLGGKILGDGKSGNYPILGDNVVIFAGAKIIGDIRIGDGATIGANSVVMKDIEECSVYAGVPARKIH